jgi:serine kinase of HPr protein (carbohydrate metabolism regulator)
MHGVFMDILGMGVLITGESGLGKSELGLELISRGNGLVADDAVDLYRINQTAIEARCPDLLQNLLEVRGIGLLDIRAIFGETAVRRKMRLKLIVHLVRRETLERDYERMPSEPLVQDVLGISVRKVVIQVVAGRNIAVLVEAAVRNISLASAASYMTDAFGAKLLSKVPLHIRNSGKLRWFMNRDAAYSLQASRSTVAANVGVNFPTLPTECQGIPITVTDSITSTETAS